LKEILMNKLLAALIAGTFALGSMAAMADDKTVTKTTPEEQAKMKADREAAKTAKAQMTPEEKNAAKKAKRKQKLQEEAQIEKVGQPNAPAKSEALQKSVQATKGDPKPLPDAKAKQEALKDTTKKAGPGQ
jgi:Ni/Co efflux regulator RcnB